MAVHAFKIVASPEPAAPGQSTHREREQAVRDTFGARLPEQAIPATDVAADPERGIPAHVLALHRVSLAHDRDTVVRASAGHLGDRDWFRVYYHYCRNDEHQPCDPWTVVREQGDVPEGV